MRNSVKPAETKAQDIEIHLNKSKKSAKESGGKIG